MTRLRILAPVAVLLLSNAPPSGSRPAPAQFVTDQHGLTFRSPLRATYCPLPSDWVGSDHGTVLFLTPPRRCGGAGYSSSTRGGDGAAAWIEVYYGYWMGEDVSPPPCHRIGSVRLFGKDRPLCRHSDGKMVVIDTTARYKADTDSEVELTLVTTPGRLNADLAKFRTMVASVRPCRGLVRTVDEKGRDGKSIAIGTGAPCPAAAKFF